MRVTIRDVAARLNLSHTTVSRALNGRDTINIPAATRERIRSTAAEMGYTPHHAARSLATGKTNFIALQLFRLDSPYSAKVARAIQEVVGADGYGVVVREYTRHDDMALGAAVDGILALDCSHFPQGFPEGVARLPVAYVGIGFTAVPTVDHVRVDLYAGAGAAVRHLIGRGARRIAHVTSVPPDRVNDARLAAYREALREAGLESELITVPSDRRGAAYGAIPEYVAAHGLPDALFCRNDELAIGACRALRERDVRLPDDVLIAGCDGIEEGEYTEPPLTTIVPPVEEMCRRGWESLKRRMDAPDAPLQCAILQPSLAVRRSTAPDAG